MNGLARLPALLDGARKSKSRRWLLNLLLGRLIPFNRPHGIRIVDIDNGRVVTSAPYRRRNHNHIRGVHACCIATVAEFCSGLLLLSHLDPARYRLIMARLEVDYHFQAKGTILAETRLEPSRLEEEILQPLRASEKILFAQVTEVHDNQRHPIATVRVTWQIKRWDAVKTAVA